MMWRLACLAFMLMGLLCCGGCGGNDTTTTPTDPPAPPPPVGTNTTSIKGFINFPGSYTVTLKRHNMPVGAPIVTAQGAEPPFLFTEVPVGDDYTLEVDNGQGILTIVRPFDVPVAGLTDVDVLTRLNSQLEADQSATFGPIAIPPTDGTATLVAYAFNGEPANYAQIVLDGGMPTPSANPTWLPGVAGGTHALMILPEEQTPFTVDLPVNTVVVIRSIFHRAPQASTG